MTKFQLPSIYSFKDLPEYKRWEEYNGPNTHIGIIRDVYGCAVHWLGLLDIICPPFEEISRDNVRIDTLVEQDPDFDQLPEEFYQQLTLSLKALWTLQLENLYPDGEWEIRVDNYDGWTGQELHLEYWIKTKGRNDKTSTFHTEKFDYHSTSEQFGKWVVTDICDQITWRLQDVILSYGHNPKREFQKAHIYKIGRWLYKKLPEIVKKTIGYLLLLLEVNPDYELMLKTPEGSFSMKEVGAILGKDMYDEQGWLENRVEQNYSPSKLAHWEVRFQEWLNKPKERLPLSKFELTQIKDRQKQGGKEFTKNAKKDVATLIDEVERLNQLLENQGL